MSDSDNRPIFIQTPWYVEQLSIANFLLKHIRGPKKRKQIKLQKKILIRFAKNHNQDIEDLFIKGR